MEYGRGGDPAWPGETSPSPPAGQTVDRSWEEHPSEEESDRVDRTVAATFACGQPGPACRDAGAGSDPV